MFLVRIARKNMKINEGQWKSMKHMSDWWILSVGKRLKWPNTFFKRNRLVLSCVWRNKNRNTKLYVHYVYIPLSVIGIEYVKICGDSSWGRGGKSTLSPCCELPINTNVKGTKESRKRTSMAKLCDQWSVVILFFENYLKLKLNTSY